jgi:hypothetical protein
MARIATSVAILMAAFAYATPDMLRQRDLSLKPSCHVTWIGLHCHITMGMRMNTEIERHPMQKNTGMRRLLFGNTRR